MNLVSLFFYFLAFKKLIIFDFQIVFLLLL